MRRLLLVLLMLTMSAQWTWAAVASACQHESGPAAQHIGHHAHVHEGRQAGQADALPAASGDTGDASDISDTGDASDTSDISDISDTGDARSATKTLFLLDADCAGCHAGGAALLPPLAAQPLAVLQERGFTPYRRFITQGLPERLIRPPHLRLA